MTSLASAVGRHIARSAVTGPEAASKLSSGVRLADSACGKTPTVCGCVWWWVVWVRVCVCMWVGGWGVGGVRRGPLWRCNFPEDCARVVSYAR